MSVCYVDTSAAMKLVFREEGSREAIDYFAEGDDRTLVSSWLIHAELHCATGRRGGLGAENLSIVLGMLDLVDLTRGDLIAAGTHAPLRSQDAIHLAVAIRVGADQIVTYDHELADAASRIGLRAVSPGR